MAVMTVVEQCARSGVPGPGGPRAAGAASDGSAAGGHPVEGLLAVLESGLDAVSPEAWAGAPAEAARAWCARLSRVGARIGAHQVAAARVLDQGGAAASAGVTSTGALLAGDFGGDRTAGETLVRTGKALSKAQATLTEQALAQGRISLAQAGLIGKILGALPSDVTAEQRQTCERALLADAARMSLRDLRARGDRILDSCAPPEVVDQVEEDLVVTRERRAWARTELSMADNSDGTWSGRFTLPEVQAQLLKTLLDAHAAPRRTRFDGGSDDSEGTGPISTWTGGQRQGLTYPQRAGRALCALIEHIPTDGFATSGGTPATVAVTLSYDKLAAQVGCGTLSTGTRISAGQVRRLACTAQILPQVLGTGSLPLDLGRRARLFSQNQRLALAERDQGCTFPGCDRPPSWCESHHARKPWAAGGTSDLADGVLLCAFHHHQVHDQGWTIRFGADGIPEYQAPGSTGWQRNARYKPPRE